MHETFPAGHPAYDVLGRAWQRRAAEGRVTPDGRLLPPNENGARVVSTGPVMENHTMDPHATTPTPAPQGA